MESLEGPPLFRRRVVTFGPQGYGAHDGGLGEDDTFQRGRLTSNIAAGSKQGYVAEAVGSAGLPQKRRPSAEALGQLATEADSPKVHDD